MSYQLSLLFGVAEGEGDFGLDVGCSPLLGHHVDQQVDQYVVILQQRDAAVPVVEGYICPKGADVGVDLTRVTLHDGLKRRQCQEKRQDIRNKSQTKTLSSFSHRQLAVDQLVLCVYIHKIHLNTFPPMARVN